MQALICTANGVALEEVPMPKVERGQALVKIEKSAISAGTELYGIRHLPKDGRKALGYIAVGVIESTNAPESSLKAGDRVFLMAPHAEYGVCDADALIPVPEGLSQTDAAGVYWAVPAFRAIQKLKLNLHEDAAVVGAGPIGCMGIQLLRPITGCLAAFDINDKRLELAGRMGADLRINPADRNAAEELRGTLPEGVHGVIEATGSMEGLRTALEIVRPSGSIVALRLPENMGDLNLESYMYRKDLKLISSGCPCQGPSKDYIRTNGVSFTGSNASVYPDAWYFRKQVETCFEMAARSQIKVAPLISHEIGKQDAPDIYKRLMDRFESKEFLGVVIDWSN